MGSARGVREKPVFSANDEGPDGPLDLVVVRGQEFGFKIPDEFVPFFQRVRNGLAGPA